MWSFHDGVFLYMAREEIQTASGEKYTTYTMKCAEGHVVHRHPDRTFPIVFALSELRMRQRKTADTIRRP